MDTSRINNLTNWFNIRGRGESGDSSGGVAAGGVERQVVSYALVLWAMQSGSV
jgi:hypothetical protein